MKRFLNGKAFAIVQLAVFLTACTNQTTPINFKMTDLKSTGTEIASEPLPVQVKIDNHRSPPSTHAAIGEFADLLCGEPLGFGYETDVQ